MQSRYTAPEQRSLQERATEFQNRHPPRAEALEIGNLLFPFIAKGQSLNHILAAYKGEIRLSEKTIYNSMPSLSKHRSAEGGDLRAENAQAYLTKLENKYRKGLSIEVFNHYPESHPNMSIVEMGPVKNATGCKKTLFTLVFLSTS